MGEVVRTKRAAVAVQNEELASDLLREQGNDWQQRAADAREAGDEDTAGWAEERAELYAIGADKAEEEGK